MTVEWSTLSSLATPRVVIRVSALMSALSCCQLLVAGHYVHLQGSCLLCRISFFIFYFNWRLISLQYCGVFCHTFTGISHGYTCVPHPDPPSHLPPHPIPQGHPSAPALSTLSHPLQNFFNQHCTVSLLAIPRPQALLMLQIVSTAL